MSPNYFSAYFKRVTGKNLREHLVEQRLLKAAELLKNSYLNLMEIEQGMHYQYLQLLPLI